MFRRWLFGLIAFSVSWGAVPVLALTCTPLNVVEGDTQLVEKKISLPSTLVTSTNWNTDFVVPEGTGFRTFRATLTPQDDGEYDIRMFLKYSDGTADMTYEVRDLKLTAGVPLNIGGSPRVEQVPYQVNLFVGSFSSRGKQYTLTVSGCY